MWIQKNKHGLVATEILIVWCPKGKHILKWVSAQCLLVSLSSGGSLQIYALKCKNMYSNKHDIVINMIMSQRDDNHIDSLLVYLFKMISKGYFVMIILISYRCIITMCMNRTYDSDNICI